MTSSDSAGRRALRVALWRSVLTLAATIGLVVAIDRGGRLLGPALMVVGAYGGARALYDWWGHRDAEWFPAEIVLVTLGWAMLAGSFAALQYVAFSLAPGPFYVDVDYAKLAAPGYRAGWIRDSSRVAGVDQAAGLLAASVPRSLVLDSVYDLDQGVSGQRPSAARTSCRRSGVAGSWWWCPRRAWPPSRFLSVLPKAIAGR